MVAIEQPHAGTRAARTGGVEKATSEVVLFVDDDVMAGEGLVTGHARHHRDSGPPGRARLHACRRLRR